MIEPNTDITGWITPSTKYILHLNTAILYKEKPTVSVPLTEILAIDDSGVHALTPVDIGEDTAPVIEEGGERHYPANNISHVEFRNNESKTDL